MSTGLAHESGAPENPSSVLGRLWPSQRLDGWSFFWTSRVQATSVKVPSGEAVLRFSETGRVKILAFLEWSTGEFGFWWQHVLKQIIRNADSLS